MNRVYTFDFTLMEGPVVMNKGRANIEGDNYSDAEESLISQLNAQFKDTTGKLAIMLRLQEVFIDMTFKTFETSYINFKKTDGIDVNAIARKPNGERIVTPGTITGDED